MSTEPGSTRARGRELALLALCHLESYPPEERTQALGLLWENPPGEADQAVRSFSADVEAKKFAEEVLQGLLENWESIDATIQGASERWRLERIERIERNVLRIATHELGVRDGAPRGVVIAEAVRLAERYGGERSAPFVNGVIESVAKELRDGSGS
jgi:N utilization substance protein B